MGTNKALMLTPTQRDFLILLLSIQPHLSQPQMTALFEDKFGIALTAQQLKTLIKNSKQKVEDLQKNEALTMELAVKVGLVSLHSKINRTIALEEIVRMGKDGYLAQTQSSRGEVVSYVKHDLKTATEAIKAIKAEWSEEVQQQANYTVIIGGVEPPKEDELEGDSEL